MAYYRDVREYLNALEAAGKLVRIKQPINKDTEMHPLVRLQYRGLPEEQRRAFLFEKVIDIKGRTFETVAVTPATSTSMHSVCNARRRKFTASGLGCNRILWNRWKFNLGRARSGLFPGTN